MVESKYTYSQLKETRLLFSKDEKGKALYKLALKKQERTPEELVELRKEFGPEKAGQLSFMYIAIKSPCELKNCGEQGKLTLYFDAGGSEDLMILCSQEHFEQALREHAKSFKKGVPSKNGWGRS